jgi:putative aldouronate transport system permease protein
MVITEPVRHHIRKTPGEQVFRVFNSLLLLTVCFVTLYPFWYVLVQSFNEGQDAIRGGLFFWPRRFTVENFGYVLAQKSLRLAYVNTIVRTAVGSFLCLMVSGLAAYAVSKKDFKGRSFFLTYFMIPMFIGGTIVSNYIVIAKLGLLDNWLVYVLPGSFNFFFLIIIRTFINGLPISLEESAQIDGASYFTIFFRIVLPLCMPVVATVLLFSAVGYWLDFYTNLLYVSKQSMMVLQYLLYMVLRANRISVLSQMQAMQSGAVAQLSGSHSRITEESVKMTVLIVITVPILLVYPFFQRYFIKGVLIGAIKG